jgi:hypothetical protein
LPFGFFFVLFAIAISIISIPNFDFPCLGGEIVVIFVVSVVVFVSVELIVVAPTVGNLRYYRLRLLNAEDGLYRLLLRKVVVKGEEVRTIEAKRKSVLVLRSH